MRKLLRRIRYWVNHRRAAAELAEEIEAHRQLQQSGMSEQEASFAGKRAMGNAVLAPSRLATSGPGAGSMTRAAMWCSRCGIFGCRKHDVGDPLINSAKAARCDR